LVSAGRVRRNRKKRTGALGVARPRRSRQSRKRPPRCFREREGGPMRILLTLAAIFGLFGCNESHVDSQHTPVGAANSSLAARPPAVEITKVISKPLDTVMHLEGELSPYERVAIYSRANGFVSSVKVDRGSRVKAGQLLVTIVAPELKAQRAEVQAKLQGDK